MNTEMNCGTNLAQSTHFLLDTLYWFDSHMALELNSSVKPAQKV